jgi:topoisomerase-4 subunit A
MPIRKLSSYEIDETTNKISALIDEHTSVNDTKKDMTKVTIQWFKQLLKKYSDNWSRKTEFDTFTKIEAAQVALTNIKLYADLEKGFIGTSMRSEKYMCDVSDIDDILVICKSGTSMVTKVSSKTFIESDIIYVNRIMKTDTTVFTIVYEVDGVEKTMIKRFTYGGYTRDKKIHLIKDIPNAKILYLHAGIAEDPTELNVELKPRKKVKFKDLNFKLKDFNVSGRGSLGVMFTKYPIEAITVK